MVKREMKTALRFMEGALARGRMSVAQWMVKFAEGEEVYVVAFRDGQPAASFVIVALAAEEVVVLVVMDEEEDVWVADVDVGVAKDVVDGETGTLLLIH